MSHLKSLAALFAEHTGKVSDKWSIYITEYDRLFQPWRDQPVRLLEIGIQNGGSLEIWSKYFTKAVKLIGCDINPDCAQLQFDDPRIAVVVADANTDDTQQSILKLSPQFDLIIDDGSHQSGDIVRSFARYFTHLNDGGLYIAEDLHCSYWQDFEGGLYQPYSSIAFFKQLADTINHEHWGIDKTRSELFSSFNRQYNTRLDEVSLAHIHSIEFINSMCVVRKAIPTDNLLGKRFIAGTITLVDEAPLPLHGSNSAQPNQSSNQWTVRELPIEEALTVRMQEIASLNQTMAERDETTTDLIRAVLAQDQNVFQTTFDATWYAKKYPDIDTTVVDPYQHYIHYGILEGRVPATDLAGFVRNGLQVRLNELQAQYNQAKQQSESQHIQLVTQEKTYTDHEQSLSQQLQAIHQELHRLEQARAQREQEFSTQLLAIQQQSDADKNELSQQYQTGIEEMRRQEAEHEWLTAERIHILNQQIHQLQTEQITREQTHTASLAALYREVNAQTQQQAQREQEFSTQLLAIQQQSDADKNELSQQYQTGIEEMRRQQAEHAWLTAEHIQTLNLQIHHLQTEQNTREQTHTAALTTLHRELKAQTQQQVQREQELSWQLHHIQSTYSWRLTERLRQAARLFKSAFFNNTCQPEVQNAVNASQQLINIGDLKKMNHVTDVPIKLDNLLSNNDAQFIYHAYRTILRRPPDPAGMLYYLQRLQNGVKKIEILAQLRLSAEGQTKLTPIQGLDKAIRPYRWRKLPLLGGLLVLTGIVPKKATKNIAAHKNTQIEAAIEMASDTFVEARGEVKCELQALHQLERSPIQDQWLSQGKDPHFSVILNEATPVMPGWHVFRFTINTENKRNVAKFYFDYGNGFSEKNTITIPYQSNQNASRAILLEQSVHAIRFDPLEAEKSFTVEHLSIDFITEVDAVPLMINRLTLTQEKYKDIKAEDLQTVMQAMAQIEKAPFTSYLESKYSATFNVQQSSIDYAEWIETVEQAAMPTPATLIASINQLKDKPLISIVMPVYNPPIEYLRAGIDSVIAQSYSHWELCIADDASPNSAVRKTLEEYQAKDNRIRIVFRTENGHISRASNSALEVATGDFVALMDHDDALPKDALYFVAMSIAEHPTALIFYSDEDKINENNERFNPHFKSDWNPDLFFSQNYVSHLGVYRRELLNKINGFRTGVEGSQDHDLLLRCLPHVQHHDIIHIPHVLYHWRAIAGSTAMASDEKDYTTQAGMKALQDYFQDNGPKGVEVKKGLVANTYHVVYPIPEPAPLVSLLIPTRDRRHLVEVAVRSILDKSTYPHYEILILDNGSVEQETLEFFKAIQKQDKRVKVLRYDHPFNFSAINNYGVEHAKGSIIGLINNDIEVISPGWLTEMVSQASRAEIGCVGAKLYFPNDTIQHGGVIMSLGGVAGHSHKYFDRSHPGYFHRLVLLQNLSGVTAAVLVVRREVYEQVNGLDVNLCVAFNDVDFCLKVREAGYRNLWTPHAELYHYESISRGTEDTTEKQTRFLSEVKFMQDKWGDALVYDPYYNPNLSRDREDFSITCTINPHGITHERS